MKNLTLFVTSKFKFSNEHFFIKTNSQVSPRTPVACEQINALIIQKCFKVLIKQIVGARAAATAIIPFQYCWLKANKIRNSPKRQKIICREGCPQKSFFDQIKKIVFFSLEFAFFTFFWTFRFEKYEIWFTQKTFDDSFEQSFLT